MTQNKHLQIIMLSLLLIAGQLGAVVHATDHPFHAHDELCASFSSFEHHVLADIVNGPVEYLPSWSNEIATVTVPGLLPDPPVYHLARAPPSSS